MGAFYPFGGLLSDHLFQMDFIQWIYTTTVWWPSFQIWSSCSGSQQPFWLSDGGVLTIYFRYGTHTVNMHISSLLDGCVQAPQKNCSVLDGYPKSNRRDLHWRVLELHEKLRRSTLSSTGIWEKILRPNANPQYTLYRQSSTNLLEGHDRSLESALIK